MTIVLSSLSLLKAICLHSHFASNPTGSTWEWQWQYSIYILHTQWWMDILMGWVKVKNLQWQTSHLTVYCCPSTLIDIPISNLCIGISYVLYVFLSHRGEAVFLVFLQGGWWKLDRCLRGWYGINRLMYVPTIIILYVTYYVCLMYNFEYISHFYIE